MGGTTFCSVTRLVQWCSHPLNIATSSLQNYSHYTSTSSQLPALQLDHSQMMHTGNQTIKQFCLPSMIKASYYLQHKPISHESFLTNMFWDFSHPRQKLAKPIRVKAILVGQLAPVTKDFGYISARVKRALVQENNKLPLALDV